MSTILNGQMDLGAAAEDVALASNTDIASFTDNNLADTAGDFTATIDWGDGTTALGTVVGSNGSFTVDGGHTYADEGFPQATVTITRPADNTQIALTGTIAVSDTDVLSVQGKTITGSPNVPLNATVATFTTTNTANTASDFVATIDWGDGTTTPGTVSGSNGSFTVSGQHTYAANGEDTITVFVNDDAPDAAFNSATSQALIGVSLGGHVVLNSATEGQALGANTTVATFADSNPNDVVGNFTATIDWGDGTTSAGTVVGANGSFSVQGDHTYADEGDVQAIVTVTRTTDNTTFAPAGTVVVADADFLTPHGKTIGSQPGQLLNNVVVATFDDTNTANVASDFTATIDWGDGTTSAGTVSGGGATFSVSGTHTYATAGQDAISVTLADGTATSTAVSQAFIGLAGAQVLLTDATEHVALAGNTPVATFTDGDLSDQASGFTAMIDWGDGTASTGTVSGANGSFTVSGSHTYADEAAAPLIATVTRLSDNATFAQSGTVAVGENDVLTGHPVTISGNPGQALSGVTVATFTDTDTVSVASDFVASIDWGDGTTTAGIVSGSGGTFSVAGSHTYAANGHETIIATLTDDAPGMASATANSTANIGIAGQLVLTSATEHVALPSNTTVASFVDSNLGDLASGFTATIDWGDGATSAGTVVGSNGSFSVQGGHTYADEANAAVVATLVRSSDHSTATGSGSVVVGENDVLTAHGTPIPVVSGQTLSNVTVATFTDTDTATLANDFVATINWGDGATSAGAISGSNGSFAVSGTHTYAKSGSNSVIVTIADDAPGTATATASTTAQTTPVHLVGTSGDDSFTAQPGDEQIDAGLGLDTISFNFKLVDATISWSGNQVIVDGPGGTSHTVLTGFEIYKFTDGTVNNADSDPLVDDLFYYSHYHDVWVAGADADAHYHVFGWKEGRDPNAYFDTRGYLAQYKDVAAAGGDPLVHYDQFGWKEGRDPSVNFDTKNYLSHYADVAAQHVDPLSHFLQFGLNEGRSSFADGHFG